MVNVILLTFRKYPLEKELYVSSKHISFFIYVFYFVKATLEIIIQTFAGGRVKIERLLKV